MSRTTLLLCIFIRCTKMGFQHFFILLFTPLTRFPELVHALLGLVGIIVTYNLAKFVKFLLGLDVSQKLKKVHLSCIQSYCTFHFHYVFLVFDCKATKKQLILQTFPLNYLEVTPLFPIFAVRNKSSTRAFQPCERAEGVTSGGSVYLRSQPIRQQRRGPARRCKGGESTTRFP